MIHLHLIHLPFHFSPGLHYRPPCLAWKNSDSGHHSLIFQAPLLIPLPKLPTPFETAELIFNHVIRYNGLPEDVVSGQGAQFMSQVWKNFMEKLDVIISFNSG